MVRQFIKADDFMLTQGRCLVVYCPNGLAEQTIAEEELIGTVIFVDSEYFAVEDVRFARISFDEYGKPYLDPFIGRSFLGLIVRRAGRLETLANQVFY